MKPTPPPMKPYQKIKRDWSSRTRKGGWLPAILLILFHVVGVAALIHFLLTTP